MLRGVNLGNRRMKMDALRAMCEELGLENPRTYVQSGNVVFETKERNFAKLTKRIEEAIQVTFGFHSDAVLRTAPEMKDAIARNPFAGRKDVVPGKLLVVFLSGDPGAELKKVIAGIKDVPEEVVLSGREIFIYFPNGQARPKLKFAVIDRALKVSWTGRNLNTVIKLAEIASD
jgi:uncharacterized protein (DUF1697 family)